MSSGSSGAVAKLAPFALMAGFGWAVIQAALTAVIVDMGSTDGLFCSGGQSQTALVTLSALVIACPVVGIVLNRSSGVRPNAAIAAVAVEAVLVALWALAGGFAAFDCALDV